MCKIKSRLDKGNTISQSSDPLMAYTK
uniref:Uncharacterized protein n=1 Tax=Arundo donax TaxID=35708 RepID=A0A0A9H171_ARUDO